MHICSSLIAFTLSYGVCVSKRKPYGRAVLGNVSVKRGHDSCEGRKLRVLLSFNPQNLNERAHQLELEAVSLDHELFQRNQPRPSRALLSRLPQRQVHSRHRTEEHLYRLELPVYPLA